MNPFSPQKVAKLKRKARRFFRPWIVFRDKKCVRCRGTECRNKKLQCSHFFNVGIYPAVEFDEENCDTLGWYCHYGSKNVGWEYRKLTEYKDFKLKQLGEKRFILLETRARNKEGKKFTVQDLEKIISCYKGRMEKLR